MTLKKFAVTLTGLLFFIQMESSLASDYYQSKPGIPPADTLKVKTPPLKDSTQVRKKALPIPVFAPALGNHEITGSVISKKTLGTSDYRNTSDFFINAPFGFVRDLGIIGQPVETALYGMGFGNISFLSDGISINNRISNSYDLNLFQSESIDSIEVLPLVRGFLFGNANNSAAVNLIPRKPSISKPFSRLRYYQAPNGEGFLDGIFNLNPFNRFNANLELTNQSLDSTTNNKEFSNWIGSARLRYMISNEINITADYKYAYAITRLSGGADPDTIRNRFMPGGYTFDQVLYDRLAAPAKFADRYQKVSDNNFKLRMLARLSDNAFTDLSFYYNSSLTEFRQNEHTSSFLIVPDLIHDDNQFRSAGINLRQDLQDDLYRLTAIANWEHTGFDSPLIPQTQSLNTFSVSGQLSFKNIAEHLSPALFAKYLSYSDRSLFSYGADAIFKLDDHISLYAGAARSGQPFSPVQMSLLSSQEKDEVRTNNTAEIRLSYSSKAFSIQTGYFLMSSHNAPAAYDNYAASDSGFVTSAKLVNTALNGFNISFSLKYGKVLFISNSSFYIDQDNSAPVNGYYKMPAYTSCGGVYYVDTLFEKNLHLKAGFNYSSLGSRSYYSSDFERMMPVNIFTSAVNPAAVSGKSSPSFQLDFFFAGRIRNAATIYFIFENIFNAQYFVVPYYPKEARGLRFGISWDFLD